MLIIGEQKFSLFTFPLFNMAKNHVKNSWKLPTESWKTIQTRLYHRIHILVYKLVQTV